MVRAEYYRHGQGYAAVGPRKPQPRTLAAVGGDHLDKLPLPARLPQLPPRSTCAQSIFSALKEGLTLAPTAPSLIHQLYSAAMYHERGFDIIFPLMRVQQIVNRIVDPVADTIILFRSVET